MRAATTQRSNTMRISIKYDAASVKKKIRVPEDWDSLVAIIKEKFNIDQSANVLLFDALGSYCMHRHAVWKSHNNIEVIISVTVTDSRIEIDSIEDLDEGDNLLLTGFVAKNIRYLFGQCIEGKAVGCIQSIDVQSCVEYIV